MMLNIFLTFWNLTFAEFFKCFSWISILEWKNINRENNLFSVQIEIIKVKLMKEKLCYEYFINSGKNMSFFDSRKKN